MRNKPEVGSSAELTADQRSWLKGMGKTLALAILPLLFFGCGAEAEKVEFRSFQGPTMGTVYNITVESEISESELKPDVDSLLVILNQQLSTYIPEATISRFNQSKSGIEVVTSEEPFFVENLLISDRVVRETNGLFNPTVMPLVNYWGFGFEGHEAPTQVDSFKIDSLLNYVGWDKIHFEVDERSTIGKRYPGVQLDFSAVAKGYGVDVVSGYLEQSGIENYLVDIGGEVCVKGPGRRGQGWMLGVSTPNPADADNIISQRFIFMRGCVATSGNYRNFRVVDGKPVGHTLHPKTGFPEMNNLLSVTIWTSTAAVADAYATAAMVAGYPAARELVESIEGIEAFFIYLDETGQDQYSWTKGFEHFLVDIE